jgi:hypothetical protein
VGGPAGIVDGQPALVIIPPGKARTLDVQGELVVRQGPEWIGWDAWLELEAAERRAASEQQEA